MNYQKYSKIPEALQNKIISAAYGDASLKTRLQVWLAIRKDDEAKKMFAEYRSTAHAVNKLDKENCPPTLIEDAERFAGIKGKRNRGIFSDISMIFVSKPIASAAVTGLAILIIAVTIIFRSNDYYDNFTQHEITQAELETKESLLIVSRIFNRTKNTVSDDILTDRVAKPIKEGINFVNKFIKEGEIK